jgi:hypothetical protein
MNVVPVRRDNRPLRTQTRQQFLDFLRSHIGEPT